MTRTSTCRTCGATFRSSPAGYTVNCPEHRGRQIAAEAATAKTCRCGKTVIAGIGVPPGTTCPRGC